MLEYHNWFMLSKEKLYHKVRKCTNVEDEFASSQVNLTKKFSKIRGNSGLAMTGGTYINRKLKAIISQRKSSSQENYRRSIYVD